MPHGKERRSREFVLHDYLSSRGRLCVLFTPSSQSTLSPFSLALRFCFSSTLEEVVVVGDYWGRVI